MRSEVLQSLRMFKKLFTLVSDKNGRHRMSFNLGQLLGLVAYTRKPRPPDHLEGAGREEERLLR